MEIDLLPSQTERVLDAWKLYLSAAISRTNTPSDSIQQADIEMSVLQTCHQLALENVRVTCGALFRRRSLPELLVRFKECGMPSCVSSGLNFAEKGIWVRRHLDISS